MITRREFLSLMAYTSLLPIPLLQGCNDNDGVSGDENVEIQPTQPDWSLLTANDSEAAFELQIEGKIPEALYGGTLYRNGAGLHERQGVKRANFIDGDGYITALRFDHQGSADFQGRFVRTNKYQQEALADKFLNDTWATLIPDLPAEQSLINANDANQSSVSTVWFNGHLYSFDESAKPYRLNPETLETEQLGGGQFNAIYAAHSKIDPINGDWMHFGLQYGNPSAADPSQAGHILIHISIIDQQESSTKYYKQLDLTAIDQHLSALGRGVYIHDFFATENFLVFYLPPVFVDLRSLGQNAQRFGLTETTLTECFKWIPSLGGKILVLSRHNPNLEPIMVDVPESSAKAFWHVFNAYEKDQQIVCDFIAYDDFNRLLDRENSMLYTLMRGEKGQLTSEGELARYTLNLAEFDTQTGMPSHINMQYSVLEERFGFEFPVINRQYETRQHRYGYAAFDYKDYTGLFHGIAKYDFNTYNSQYHDFGDNSFCGEPIFCPDPNQHAEDAGWLLVTVYDALEKQSFIAILNAQDISANPVAKIHLGRALSIHLHGFWKEQH
ncbi:MAG: carotenoid oxygenase family protein [bacterium]